MPRLTVYTHRGSRFAVTAGMHQPNDDKRRSGGITSVTRGGECVLSSQRVDERGAMSRYGIAYAVTPLDCYLTDCRTVPAYDKRLGLPDCRDKISTMIR